RLSEILAIEFSSSSYTMVWYINSPLDLSAALLSTTSKIRRMKPSDFWWHCPAGHNPESYRWQKKMAAQHRAFAAKSYRPTKKLTVTNEHTGLWLRPYKGRAIPLKLHAQRHPGGPRPAIRRRIAELTGSDE